MATQAFGSYDDVPPQGEILSTVNHSFADAAAYERFMGRWSRAVGPIFLDWLSPPLRARWLEVGCGTGVFTQLIVDRCVPAAVVAIDPAVAQVNYAKRMLREPAVTFEVADVRSLPLLDSSFDVVASALVLNFVGDAHRALAEIQRVLKPSGRFGAYVWDFSVERSPSWPLRAGMRRFGLDVPEVLGTWESSLSALHQMMERSGYRDIETRQIDVTASYADFDDFWGAQTPSYNPTTHVIDGLAAGERTALIETVRLGVPVLPNGEVRYSARANAIVARKAGTPH